MSNLKKVSDQLMGLTISELNTVQSMISDIKTMKAKSGIVVGGKVPILLTSRADSSAARLSSVSLASIWSNIQLEMR